MDIYLGVYSTKVDSMYETLSHVLLSLISQNKLPTWYVKSRQGLSHFTQVMSDLLTGQINLTCSPPFHELSVTHSRFLYGSSGSDMPL